MDKLTIQKIKMNITPILPEVDVNICSCNLSIKLPLNLVGIRLPSKKNKSKLNDMDESK